MPEFRVFIVISKEIEAENMEEAMEHKLITEMEDVAVQNNFIVDEVYAEVKGV